MSSIEKMQILGIRSFSPDKAQIIEFFSPLTLILGPNGTGKTTIIECLRYMTTGDKPPGGKAADSAFVHDPKIAHESSVKAQVKLQLRDVRNQQCIVTRSLEATQKAKSVTTKTLDGTIKRRGPDGKAMSISSKCTEIDREMISLLGVAKPILENVIFCHQEESNWPLSEAKKLKEKFDDIFASTRYVKALDNIRKFRKDQTGVVKEYTVEINYLRQNKNKAIEIREQYEETKTKLEASKESVQKIEDKLQPIRDQLETISAKEGEILQIHTKKEKMKSEREQMIKSTQEIRDGIENEFQGTYEELRRMLSEFEEKLKEREDSQAELEEKLRKTNDNWNAIADEKTELLLNQGKLEQEHESHLENIRKRDKKLHEVAKEHKLSGYTGRLNDEMVDQFLKDLLDKSREVLDDAKKRRGEFEKEEEKIAGEIQKSRSSLTKHETELKMRHNQMKENQREIREINQRLSRVAASGDRLKGIRNELQQAEEDLVEAERSVDIDSLKTTVSDLQKQKEEYNAKYRKLDSEFDKMMLESNTRTQLDMFRKEKANKEELIKRLKIKNEDSLKNLLGSIPSGNLKKAVDDATRDKSRRTAEIREKINKMNMKLSQRNEQQRNLKEQLANMEKQLKDYESEVYSVCETQDLEKSITDVKRKIERSQEKKSVVEGSNYVFKEFIRKMRENLSNDPPCPLCHRCFEDRSEVETLIEELEERIEKVPENLVRLNREIDGSEKKHIKMQQIKPLVSKINDLKEKDIPQVQTKLSDVQGEVENLRKSLEKESETLEELEIAEASAKSMQPDMAMIEKYQSELRDVERKINQQQSKISGSDSDRSVAQVREEKDEAQNKLDTVSRDLDRKREKIAQHNERVQTLKASVNSLKEEKLDIEKELQERKQLEERKEELDDRNDALTAEIQETEDNLEPIKREIERLETKKTDISDEKESTYEKDKEKYDHIRTAGKEVKDIHTEIRRYSESGKEEELDKCREVMNRLERKAKKYEDERERLQENIDTIKNDVATQKERQRELEDNQKLRKKQKEIKQKEQEIAELEKEIGDLDVTNMEREKNRLGREMENLKREKHRCDGRQQQYEEQIKKLRAELQEDMYKDAEIKYRDKMIALRTTELANSDLDKYYKALDRTIMKYHTTKMEEINKIIRELWRNTYRGHDIETIEIRSDEDERAPSGASVARRTYSYRVVMIRQGTALDMRGRCSAGQKVLASLIIRLALAETFCLNCGILALDEPTTNLDRENIESLAYALVEIIKSRSKQKNFQLLIITHDEDFIELLGRSEYVDDFFKIKKNADGCSVLSKAKVQDLHSR